MVLSRILNQHINVNFWPLLIYGDFLNCCGTAQYFKTFQNVWLSLILHIYLRSRNVISLLWRADSKLPAKGLINIYAVTKS